MNLNHRLKAASRAALWHLLGSALVAAGAATLVFGLWYPYPYRELSGGQALFWLVVGVDLVCGPLLTLVLFTPQKPRAELVRDLGLVGLIQLTALAYGLWTVAVARPVFLVFEYDRFRVVSAADIEPTNLGAAMEEFKHLGWFGPKIIAAQVPRSGDKDFLKSIELSVQGLGPALRPSAWRPYGSFKDAALGKAQPLALLKTRYPERLAEIEAMTAKTGLALEKIGYVPVQGRHDLFWVALVAMDDARVVGFLPVDGL